MHDRIEPGAVTGALPGRLVRPVPSLRQPQRSDDARGECPADQRHDQPPGLNAHRSHLSMKCPAVNNPAAKYNHAATWHHAMTWPSPVGATPVATMAPTYWLLKAVAANLTRVVNGMHGMPVNRTPRLAANVFLRDLDPHHVVDVPVAPGWTRLVPPQAAVREPANRARLCRSARALSTELRAVVTEVTGTAEGRPAVPRRRDLALAIAEADRGTGWLRKRKDGSGGRI